MLTSADGRPAGPFVAGARPEKVRAITMAGQEMAYDHYKLHFSRCIKAKQYWTLKGAQNAAERFRGKREHGEIYGYWYEENGFIHMTKIGTF